MFENCYGFQNLLCSPYDYTLHWTLFFFMLVPCISTLTPLLSHHSCLYCPYFYLFSCSFCFSLFLFSLFFVSYSKCSLPLDLLLAPRVPYFFLASCCHEIH